MWFVEVEEKEDNESNQQSQSPVSLVYCAPEKMTEGTYNSLLLAVRHTHQGQGYGTRLMQHLEKYLREERGGRILLVETSGNSEYERTRLFYSQKLGYDEEGLIREFYQPGEDKIIYRKRL